MSRFLGSSITKKITMALLGLFLILFLPVHLGINFLLLKSDPEPFNKAAHFMATFWLIKGFEVLLLASFLLHIFYGIFLQIQNWLARGKQYKITNYSQTSFFSKFMIWTGLIIIIFLIIHFMNFYFIKIGWVQGDPENFYGVAHQLFKIPAYIILYIFSFLILGFHLAHTFWSAFQTLGWNTTVLSPVFKGLGTLFAILIPLGFTIIPLVIFFTK
ncbi:MAG TPA: succinate dehydrogenase cytochrome b subunit [Bacteroidetes bacterium]|nr:succinate dehydrogenase cytochrome b subunit [Bacteroidota bacterium]